MQRPVSNESTDGPRPSGPSRGPAAANDANLLDAYSQAVIRVVETMTPTVVSLSSSGGAGSGFLVSADGLALTNSHVVAGRRDLFAFTSDGDRIPATVCGDDPATDLAAVRLAARDLPFALFGSSDALRVGQLVIAIGSPLGLHSTVSTGIVSGLGRSLRAADGRLIEQVIQHTAPINPGNSGGPLVDSRCQVVGINAAMIAPAQGLGLAVPAATAEWILQEFLAHGRVRRRQLGVVAEVVELPRAAIREFDLLGATAVAVRDVQQGSAADEAGLCPGDWIVALADRVVESHDDLHRLLNSLRADQPVLLTVIRGHSLLELPIAPRL